MRVSRFVLVALLITIASAPLRADDDVKVAALIGLARVSRDSGDSAAAARYFEQVRELRPLSTAEMAEYFWILTKVDGRRALGVARDVLKIAPADDNVRDAAIGIAITLSDEAAAAALAQDGTRGGKDRTQWHRRLGDSYARAGRMGDAADAYLSAAASPDGSSGDWLNAAVALTASERYVDAIPAWTHVPSNTLAAHPEHARLRLLAIAKGAPANEAAPELTSWLATNQDREVQSWLVDSLADSRNFAAAYAAALPLTAGPDRERWLRRAAEFARSARRISDAADAYEQLLKVGRPTRADYVALIELRLQQGEQIRALDTAGALAGTLTRCDDQVLSLIDRVPEPAATDRLRAAVERWNCPADRWGQRLIDRSVAESRFDIALAAIERFNVRTPDAQRLHGQLLLWTGAPAAALTILEPYVATHPADVDGRFALIDAMRAVGRVDDAFTAATPLYSSMTLPSDRVLSLAELAGNAGRHQTAVALLNRVSIGDLTPAAGLVLLDATVAAGGYDKAVTVARELPLTTPAWRPTALRALTVEMVAGSIERAATLRGIACPNAARDCDAAEADALRVLVDSWRESRSAAIVERVATYADRHRSDASAQAMAAELLLETGQAERALPMLTLNSGALSSSGQALLARALADVAVAHHRGGRQREALQMAQRAVAYDLANSSAWFAAFDAAVALGGDEASGVAHDFAPIAAENPALLIAVGDHVAGLVQPSRDAAARQIIGMLEAADTQPAVSTNLTQARLFAALEDWGPAVRSLDAELRERPGSADALRLRAEVLGWSGQHAAALGAYDEYLKSSPDDVAARRQQARVAGWGSRYTEANQRYATLVRLYPRDRAIAAEAAAKRAFYAGRWHEAISAYDAWIAVEPDDSEARFERTVALRSAGNPAAADAALTELAAQTGHRLAVLALSRSEDIRRPTATVVNDLRSASGFEGTRLLSMQQQRGLLTVPFGHGTGGVSVSAGHVRAESDVRAQQGYRAEAATHVALSSRTALDAGAGVWTFASRSAAEATAAMTFSGNDRVSVSAGFAQQAIQENLATVNSGLTARGPFAALRVGTPRTSFETRAAWQRLSDDNTRREITFSASRLVSERLQGFRMIAWGQSLGYSARRGDYFSPDAFVRLDGGAEFTHLLQRPRFAGDRSSSVTVSFVEGTDNHGVLYHHPTMTTHLQLSRRVALNGRAEIIRSSTYRESSLFVGLDLANFLK